MFRHCINRTRCEPVNLQQDNDSNSSPSVPTGRVPPPSLPVNKTTEQLMWEKMKSQPLVPLGCLVTAFFLGRGLYYLQRRDSRKQQIMMRYRVGSQFLTLLIFCNYVGWENIDWRLAPYTQDRWAAEKLKKQQEQERLEKERLNKEALEQQEIAVSPSNEK